jgi:hypothetical protein
MQELMYSWLSKKGDRWPGKNSLSRMNSGRRSNRCCRSTSRPAKEDADAKATARSSKALPGSCVVELDGKTCRKYIRRQRRVGDDCTNGKNRVFGSRYGVSSCPNSTNGANSNGKRRLPTAVLPRRKKGALRRQDQTRKGYEVDGGGRWPGSPSRCSS